MKLSIVVPAKNEEGSIAATLGHITDTLSAQHIAFEVVVVDDYSTDATARIVEDMAARQPGILLVRNPDQTGYGMAVRAGLRRFSGDAVAIMMADGSDDAADLVGYWQALNEGADCAFGSRFIRGGRVVDYPTHKLILNRFANLFIRALFGLHYNDVTNAFKCYRRAVIEGMQPLISRHFNLTVEMPLKAIVRGYSYAVLPIAWTNRQAGISKLKIKEMGSRYLFIVLYLWLEKYLSRGDYRREAQPQPERVRHHHV